MKKMYKYMLLFILIMFGFVGEVRAESTLVCSSTVEGGKKFNFYRNDNNYSIVVEEKKIKTTLIVYNIKYRSPSSQSSKIKAAFFTDELEKNFNKNKENEKCPNYSFESNGNYCFDYTSNGVCKSHRDFKKASAVKLKNKKNDSKVESEEDKNKHPLCTYNLKNGDEIVIVLKKGKVFGFFGFETSSYYIEKNGVKISDLDDSSIENFAEIRNSTDPGNIPCPIHIYISNKKQNKKKESKSPYYCFDNGGYYTDSYCEKIYDYSAKDAGELEIKTKEDTYKKNKEELEEKGVEIPEGVELKECYGHKCLMCKTYGKDGKYAFIYKEDGTDDGFYTTFTWKSNFPKLYKLGSDPAFISEDSLKKLENNECPKYMYADKDWVKEVCFDDDGEYCEGKDKGFETDQTEIEDTSGIMSDSEFEKTKPKDNNLIGPEVEELLKTNYGIENIMEICAFSKEDVKNPDVDQIFVVNDTKKYTYFKYSGDELSKMELSEDGDKIKYKSSCVQLKKIHYREERKELVDHYNLFFDSNAYLMQWWHFGESSLVYEDIGPIETCEDLLGVDLINEINSYMLYIKVAVPILIIVLGSIDFGKAFIASDEDAMKKAQKRFMMRIMIGMVIFFIPSIVKILLNIANQVWGVIGSDTCGIMF